jgi:hypothetical protein
MRGGISRLLHRREYLGLRECGSGPICVPHHSLQTPEWTVGAPAEPARRWTARCPRQDIPGVWCQKGSGRGPPGARECIFVPDGTNKVAGTRYTVPCFPWRYCRCLPAGPAYTTGRLLADVSPITPLSQNTHTTFLQHTLHVLQPPVACFLGLWGMQHLDLCTFIRRRACDAVA